LLLPLRQSHLPSLFLRLKLLLLKRVALKILALAVTNLTFL
jgi:hypothetical protein